MRGENVWYYCQMNLFLCMKEWSDGQKAIVGSRRILALPPNSKACGKWSPTTEKNCQRSSTFKKGPDSSIDRKRKKIFNNEVKGKEKSICYGSQGQCKVRVYKGKNCTKSKRVIDSELFDLRRCSGGPRSPSLAAMEFLYLTLLSKDRIFQFGDTRGKVKWEMQLF